MEGSMDLTHDDILRANEAIAEQTSEPKKIVFTSSTIEHLNKKGFVRVDEDGRMFIKNYHQMPQLNGIELFASDNLPSDTIGYEVSGALYDECEQKQYVADRAEKQNRRKESGYFSQTGKYKKGR